MEAAYHDAVVEKLREEMLEEKTKALEEARLGLEEKHRLVLEEQERTNEEKRKEDAKRIEAEKQVRGTRWVLSVYVARGYCLRGRICSLSDNGSLWVRDFRDVKGFCNDVEFVC